MVVTLEDRTYELVRGSDSDRDGMYLELTELVHGRPEDVVVEIFYWDAQQRMTVTVFRRDIPLHVLEYCIEQAHTLLPPIA